jgi:anti-repressor protein
MEELIKIKTNEAGQKVVSARELHSFLEAGSNSNTWFANQAERCMLVYNEDFIQISEQSTGGRPSIDYVVTISGAKEISMMNGGEKGKAARMYFLECERQAKSPKMLSPKELAQMVIDAEDAKEKAILMLEVANNKIEEDKPKVVFADSVIGSSNSILIRQFAKDLTDSGFEIGQNRLFEWFRENKYLMTDNEPYQNYITQGLFEVIVRSIGSGTETFTSRTTKITGKGCVYFADKIKNGYGIKN